MIFTDNPGNGKNYTWKLSKLNKLRKEQSVFCQYLLYGNDQTVYFVFSIVEGK